MASLWQKTLYYLGLVDENDAAQAEAHVQGYPQPGGGVTVQATPAGPDYGDPGETLEEPAPQGRRVEPPLTARRRYGPESALADAGVIVTRQESPAVRTVTARDLESEIIEARSYTDAQLLADHIRANIPVVLDLRQVEPAMVRRLVDFASGLTYALGGSMRKVAQGVILVTPANVNITRDERRRLMSLGLYESSESG